MSRSNKEERSSKRRYADNDRWMESGSTGYTASFLKLPKGVTLYSPEKGLALIDILPYEVGKGNPHADKGMLYWQRTFWTHRGIGPNQETFVCPAKTFSKPCPICEAAQKMRRDADDEEEEKMAKALLPKMRQIFNLIDLNEPKKGVQLWEMSYFLFGQQLQKELDALEEDESDRKYFFSADAGYSLKVGFDQESMGSNKFLSAGTIKFRPRKEQYDENEILEQTHCLDALLIELGYDELNEKFLQSGKPKSKGKAKDDDDDADDEESEDEEDDTDSDDEDDDALPAKKKGKRPAPPDDDDDEDDSDSDDDDSDDEDEEPEPPKKKGKKAPEPDEDDDSEDDSDEDDSEDEDDGDETPKGGKFRTASDKDVKRAKKSAAARKVKDDDDDSDDEDDSDSDEDEEDEDEEPPVKKGKKKPEPDDDADDDDDMDDFDADDEEEDEEPAPKKKKK